MACIARKPGTPSGYYTDGCSCFHCRVCHANYKTDRRRQMAYGLWQPWTDADPARRHVRELAAKGLGYARIAKLAGLSKGAVENFVYPRGGKPPVAQIRRATAEAILAVRAEPGNLAAGRLIDATPTRRRVEALMAIGWTAMAQAQRSGLPRAVPAKALHSGYVHVATARAIAALYEHLWETPAPESYGRTMALRYAYQHGFHLPQAWDDIDAPDAVPHDPTEPDPLPDEVLVALALKEQWPLVRIERRIDRAAVVTALAGTGIAPSTVAARLKTSTPVVTKLLAECAA